MQYLILTWHHCDSVEGLKNLSPCFQLATENRTLQTLEKGGMTQQSEPVVPCSNLKLVNKGMGSVEDQQLASFPIMQHYAKANKTFFNIADIGIYNSYGLQAKKIGKKGRCTKWKVSLAEEIIEETAFLGYRRQSVHTVGPMHPEVAQRAHLSCQTPPNPAKQKPSSQCLCGAKGKKSKNPWECKKCDATRRHARMLRRLSHNETSATSKTAESKVRMILKGK